MAEEQKEIGNNCGACKKALSRAKRYYRSNDYYCNIVENQDHNRI